MPIRTHEERVAVGEHVGEVYFIYNKAGAAHKLIKEIPAEANRIDIDSTVSKVGHAALELRITCRHSALKRGKYGVRYTTVKLVGRTKAFNILLKKRPIQSA